MIALVAKDPHANCIAFEALERSARLGPIYACGAVFAEMLGFPGREAASLRNLFSSVGISIDWRFEEADWLSAGIAYQCYVLRRKSGSPTHSRLMLADFLIGAHAMTRGYTLLTADRRIYRAVFPTLEIETI